MFPRWFFATVDDRLHPIVHSPNPFHHTEYRRSVTIKVEPAWFLKQLGRASVAAAIAAGAFVLGGSYYADMPPHLFLKHTGRFWRAAWCGLVTTVDYKVRIFVIFTPSAHLLPSNSENYKILNTTFYSLCND